MESLHKSKLQIEIARAERLVAMVEKSIVQSIVVYLSYY